MDQVDSLDNDGFIFDESEPCDEIETVTGSLKKLTLSSKEEKIVQQWKRYGVDLTVYCDQLLHGIEGTKPKKPKVPLNAGNIQNRKGKLSGMELHFYLTKRVSRQQEQHSSVCMEWPVHPPKTLSDLQDYLERGYASIQNKSATLLGLTIEFGNWLNVAFRLHESEKKTGKREESWKQWVGRTIGIQDAYSRKLRCMASILSDFPMFKRLAMPFSEIYRHRKEIQEMLKDEDIAALWKV